jgi:hypothetical protein
MTPRVQKFLVGSGVIFLLLGFFRVYLLAEEYWTDRYFAPHLLVTLLSLVIAGAILRVGLLGERVTRRSALSLIRSGSILLVIWGYRTYLILRTVRSSLDLKAHLYLAAFYVVLGTIVMLVGLRLSRKLRHVPLAHPSVSS